MRERGLSCCVASSTSIATSPISSNSAMDSKLQQNFCLPLKLLHDVPSWSNNIFEVAMPTSSRQANLTHGLPGRCTALDPE